MSYESRYIFQKDFSSEMQLIYLADLQQTINQLGEVAAPNYLRNHRRRPEKKKKSRVAAAQDTSWPSAALRLLSSPPLPRLNFQALIPLNYTALSLPVQPTAATAASPPEGEDLLEVWKTRHGATAEESHPNPDQGSHTNILENIRVFTLKTGFD